MIDRWTHCEMFSTHVQKLTTCGETMQNFSAHKASCDKSKTYSHGDDLVVLENGSSRVGEMTHLQIEHLKFSNVFKMSSI